MIQLGDFTTDPPAIDCPGVYILLDEGGTPIYVGQSGAMIQRSKAHRRKKWGPQIASTRFLRCTGGIDERLVIETVCILRYRPRHNRMIKLGLRLDGSLHELQFVGRRKDSSSG